MTDTRTDTRHLESAEAGVLPRWALGQLPSHEGELPTPAGPEAGGWLRRLWPIFAAHRGLVVVAVVSATVAILAQALIPLVQARVIDGPVLGHTHNLGALLGLMGVLTVVLFGFGQVRRYTGGRIAWDVDYDMRNAVFAHLQGLDFTRHDELQTGQLVSRTNSDLQLVRQLFNQTPNILSNALQFLLALGIMFVLSPLLAATTLPFVPILFWFSLRMRKLVYPSQWEAQARMAEMIGKVDDATTGVRVVKGFGQERREFNRVFQALRILFASRMRNLRLRARRTSTLQALPQFTQVFILGIGGYLAFHHHISIGTLVAFMTYMAQLAAPARQMGTVIVTAQQARAGAERVLELLDSLPDVTEAPDAQSLTVDDGRLSFEGVSFGYLRSEPILRGFDLEVAPGERVGIVGASGSGKSTIGLLLPRFYDVQAGRVCVDGVDVREATFDSLRRQIGVVFEDAFLFSDTVRSNIAFGRPDATHEQIEAAARAAEAHQFICDLPDGYDTLVGERGLLLSGGQRQRITLARALLTDPKILLLDDATSSIDSRVEEEIHHTLRRLMVGRTTILIAHRRSTLRLASRIVVLDGGVVVDEGTHEELIGRCERYRELISGPGERIESLMAEAAVAGAAVLDQVADGRSAGAWARPSAPDGFEGARFDLVSTAGPRVMAGGGAGMGGRGGGGGGRSAMAAPPTPELMEAISRLPPVRDWPAEDLVQQTAPVVGAFNFWRYLRPLYPQLALGALFIVLDTACLLAGPQFVRFTIDNAIGRHDALELLVLICLYFAVYLADWFFQWREIFLTGRVGERLLFGLRAKIFGHLQRLGMDFYDREMGGRIITRIGSDVDTLSQLMQSGLVNALVSGLNFFGVAALLVVLNARLSLFVFCVIPPLLAATLLYRAKSSRAYDRQRERISAVNADLAENVSGVRVIQAFRREERNTKNFRTLTLQYRDAGIRSNYYQSIFFPFAQLVGNGAIMIVLGVGAAEYHRGVLSAGALVAFLLYLTQLFAPIQQLSLVFDSYQQASAGLRRISELLQRAVSVHNPAIEPAELAADADADADAASEAERVRPRPAISGAIDLVGVHFAYPGQRTEALSGIDLRVAAGETVALVGETGAGKSTVVKLIARFYDPTAGRILIDRVPLAELDLEGYRRRLGYVPQEPFLFATNIRDNIAYGRPDATDEEVEAAARNVGAHEFIVAAGGYLTPVREGGRSLSIGQRQLICFARALLVEPAIILLDEATSNLDLASEARVNHAMEIVAHGRTTVIIAHRLQTAARADRIFVIDGGTVVEAGTHEELVAAGGNYAGLWRAFDLAR